MSLESRVRIAPRYLRSVRIDTDFGDTAALDGFVCPQSSVEVLLTMARHVSETGQCAFTWTGPYGSGKSSLAVALSTLLAGDDECRRRAGTTLGPRVTAAVHKALPPRTRGWRVLPVMGRRDDPVAVLGETLLESGFVARRPRGGWTENTLVLAATAAAAANPRRHGGLVVIIDEMGKFLEGAARDGLDLHIFQQLAESASRSNGRLLVIGVLHQAFEEYARRLSREARDEWAKIQGRYFDLALNTTSDEQIDLLSRAIESSHRPCRSERELSRSVAAFVHRERRADAERLAHTLERCWPLHPVVACLLGPISRRRFGQNQRSIFGFLNSAEPHGFRDFLKSTENCELYRPDQLWDYLRVNLEPSIMASPDCHRWTLAVEVVERCESAGGDDLHIRLLKTIAIVDLFKDRSGLRPGFGLLHRCFPDVGQRALRKALDELDARALTLFKKFLDAWAIYAGSDFDIDGAVRLCLEEAATVDFSALTDMAGLQPLLAKRHYHDTGALRWFEVNLVPLCDATAAAASFAPSSGAVGQFLLAIPTDGEGRDKAEQLCRDAARCGDKWDTVVGLSERAWTIMPLAHELVAVEKVRNDSLDLVGDPVARREVTARLAALQGQLEAELQRAFNDALWYRKHCLPRIYRYAELNRLASDLADRKFDQAPKMYTEVLNRQRPSGSAIAGQNALLRRMVCNQGERRLGIAGYPAEGSLFDSILADSGLYVKRQGTWRFIPPQGKHRSNLAPLWDVACRHLRNNAQRMVSISEIYDLWREPPYGIKDGLMPVFAVAFILSQQDKLAAYREGTFRAYFSDVDVDYLTKDSASIQLRWMDLSAAVRQLLSGVAEIVCTLDQGNRLPNLEPIDVARGLIAIYDRLPTWSKRTMRLSANAVRIRDVFKRAHDPNKFLFDDVPEIVGGDTTISDSGGLRHIVSGLREGLEELVHSYPSMLGRLRDIMLAELLVPNMAPGSLAELRERAENIRQLGGDFRLARMFHEGHVEA